MGDDSWKILVMPGGHSRPDASRAAVLAKMEFVAVCLEYTGDLEELRAAFTLTLVNQLPGGEDVTKAEPLRLFGRTRSPSTCQGRCVGKFVKRAALENEANGFRRGDCIILRAVVTSVGAPESTVAALATAWTPANTIAVDMGRILAEGLASDITLRVDDGREFPAHRTVLRARSPYFEALFASSMRDASLEIVTASDVPSDAFQELLLWMYTGEVSEGVLQVEHMSEHLLMAANRFACGGLKMVCEAALCEGLAVNNAATRLVLAEQAEADLLKEGCLDFLKLELAEVMKTAGWKDVVAAGATLMGEVCAATASPVAGRAGAKRAADQVDAVETFRVGRLRAELQKRGLCLDGRRAELVERLQRAVRGAKQGRGGRDGEATHARAY